MQLLVAWSVADVGRWLASFAVACGVGLGANAGEPDENRQEELLHTLRHDCGSCHGLTMKGGLGPPLLPSAVADASDEALIDIIMNGVPGPPMPPWSPELSIDEASWLVGRLKDGL